METDKYKHSKIHFDRDNFRLMHHLGESKKVKSFSQYVDLVISQKKSFDLNMTELDINKQTIHIQRPIIPNLKRLSLFDLTLPKGKFQHVFGFSINQMNDIIVILILRCIVSCNSVINQRKALAENYYKVLGKTTDPFWFTVNDLASLCMDIPTENIVSFLNLLSIDCQLTKIDEITQFLIYKYNNQYVLPYWVDFCDVIFALIERKVLSNLDQLGTTKDEYFLLRGRSFERMVYDDLSHLMPNIHTNAQYVDLKRKKRELDVLVIDDSHFINFECKSSAFNIFDYESEEIAKLKYQNAFARTFDSINALSDLQKSGEKIIVYAGRIGHSPCILNQTLNELTLINIQVSLSPIEYIGTNIQYCIERLQQYEVQPIVLSYADFFIICYCYYHQSDFVLKYFQIRQDYLNRIKKLRLDIDEIDAFGLLTDENNNIVNDYVEMGNDSDIDMTLMVSNGIYRDTFNKQLNNNDIGIMIDNQPEPLKSCFIKLLRVYK